MLVLDNLSGTQSLWLIYQILSVHVFCRAREEIESSRSSENTLISTILEEIKQFRIENDTLQAELERKIEDNAEITRICDEMLAQEATKMKS